MIIAEVFASEHALFRALLGRMELELQEPFDAVRAPVREALRYLIPSLDRHAEIENIVFLHAPDGHVDATLALAEVDSQHQQLAALRAEILAALEQDPGDGEGRDLRTLLADLVRGLRRHLQTEEDQLWPLYRSALAQALDSVSPVPIGRRADGVSQALALGMAALTQGQGRGQDTGPG